MIDWIVFQSDEDESWATGPFDTEIEAREWAERLAGGE